MGERGGEGRAVEKMGNWLVGVKRGRGGLGKKGAEKRWGGESGSEGSLFAYN
jgi:hypothetical protein